MNINWLKPIELIGNKVSLIPMQPIHAYDLVKAASDGELWNLWYTGVPSAQTVKAYIQMAMNEQLLGRSLAFVIKDNTTNNIIGSTRFCNADTGNQRVEIGYTWYAKSYQKTATNSESKLLLLTYAFESLHAIAVEFRTNWHNQASRAAIARLGAKQDGVLRNHQRMEDGSYRDTVVFSIINQEWLAVKNNLLFKLKQYD
jgi:RimJ/RimL family protein N-acetyltransferase